MNASEPCIKRKDRLRFKLMKQSSNVSAGHQRKTTADDVCVHIFITTLMSRNYATLNDIIHLISASSQLLRQNFSKIILLLTPILPLISQQLYDKATVLLTFCSQSSLRFRDFLSNRNSFLSQGYKYTYTHFFNVKNYQTNNQVSTFE